MAANVHIAQFLSRLNLTPERAAVLARSAGQVSLIVAGAYIVASFVSAYTMSGLMSSALAANHQRANQTVIAASVNLTSTDNYRDIEKSIRERNLFNSSGDFPEEKSSGGVREGTKTATFDINAACNKPTVNIELIGTIFLGGAESVATVQESGYSESDAYREGDIIVGNDQASVAKIERNRLIINNRGVKECLELASEMKGKEGAATFPDTGNGAPLSPMPKGAAVETGCILEEKYIHDELGPGFGTIIQKARLVPNTADNQMNGFKIFAIDQTSLYGKTGLQNGDVITQVNETSLKQPEQGFALLEAFSKEKEVRIHILRNGTQPMMLTCRIQ